MLETNLSISKDEMIRTLDEFGGYEVDESDNSAFVVDNDEKADWALRKLKVINKKMENVNDIAYAEKARIDAWASKEMDALEYSKGYFEGLLGVYLDDLRKHDPKAKISLPNGKVWTRKSADKWNYDEETLLKFIKENEIDHLIVVKESLDKKAIKETFDVVDGVVVNSKSGELVEGIQITEGKESLVFKF